MSRPGPTRERAASALDGLLLAEKGAAVTSFQVVAHLRRVLGVAKVGHGGTLDPMATGILPVLLGAATKVTAYLTAQDKEYVATIRLGVTTDTLDATGRVLEERPVPPLGRAHLVAVLGRFEGEIDQVPPMFSALHAGGRRLHELARAGIEVERAPRRVRIDEIELGEWASPRLRVRVACGKGTYIRSLAADVGAALGCGAHLEALQRTRVGPFRLDDAAPWAVIRDGDRAALARWVRPTDDAVRHLPLVRLDETAARRLRQGQRLTLEGVPASGDLHGPCRLYVGGRFLGLAEAGPHGLRSLCLIEPALDADRLGSRPVSP